MSLSVKQKNFLDEYIKTGNGTQSAIAVGYAESSAGKQANRILNKPESKQYLKDRMAELRDEKIMDEQEILYHLSSIGRGEPQKWSTESVSVKDGKEERKLTEGSSTPQVDDRIKALELLGKRYVMWTDKQQIDVQASVMFSDERELED